MDLLRIEDKVGYFSLDETNKKIVSQVTNEDIKAAIELLLESKDINIADDEDTALIANPAQKIVFEQLRTSFKEILDSRQNILDEIDSVFAAAEAKYLKQGDQPAD